MSLTNFDQDQSRTSLANCSNEINSTVATPEEFVTKYGGKRVIKKILIANNGIAGTQTFLGFPIRPYKTLLDWLDQSYTESCVFDIAKMNGFPFPFQN